VSDGSSRGQGIVCSFRCPRLSRQALSERAVTRWSSSVAGARPSPARHDSGCSRECSPRATAGPRSMEPLTFGFVVQGRHCQALQAVAQVLGEPRFTLGRPGVPLHPETGEQTGECWTRSARPPASAGAVRGFRLRLAPERINRSEMTTAKPSVGGAAWARGSRPVDRDRDGTALET